MHEGHRERLRARYLHTGLDSFEEHQALEMLLFHAIPRADTNPTAHALIKTFGSLRGVLDAEYSDLLKVDGVGPNAALLIRLVRDIHKKYSQQKAGVSGRLRNARDAALYAAALLEGEKLESLYVICLDKQLGVRHAEALSKGTVDELAVYPRRVAELAMRFGSPYVILAHNHPGGDPRPSGADIATTLAVKQALQVLDIVLLDHLVISSGHATSMARDGLIAAGEKQDQRLSRYEEDTRTDPGEPEGLIPLRPE